VTQQQNYFERRSPADIRSEMFSHRMRGLDEDEVREYLHELADQILATDAELAGQRAEIEDLRNQNRRLREKVEEKSDEINPQAVALFSQAQQVADQLVEEAVVSARDLMMSARLQQREILERARQQAEEAARRADGAQASLGAVTAPAGYTTPIPEIEYVRTFAQVAQVQLRSVIDALSEEVDRLATLPQLDGDDAELAGRPSEPQALPLPHSRASHDGDVRRAVR
jgi:cell division initiation protein